MKGTFGLIIASLFIVTNVFAQDFHFGVKGGVLGNKASVSGMRDHYKCESLTGFQIGPMLQYRTGFYGLVFDASLLYAQRGAKISNLSNKQDTEIKTQSIDIPIEAKWEFGLSPMFDLFLGIGPSFSFLVDKDNWGRQLAHIAIDMLDSNLPSMGWRSTEVGLNLGGGVKLFDHLMASCYFNIGLTQAAKHHIGNKHEQIDDLFDGNVFRSRNKYWQVTLAYLF